MGPFRATRLAALVVCVVLVGACQAAASPSASTAATASPGATTAAATPSPSATVLPPDTTGRLTVLEWAGYDQGDDPKSTCGPHCGFFTDFQQAYPKVTVGFETGASDADVLAKMLGGDQADLFHFYSGWAQLYVDAGLAEEIDTSQLKNWDKVPDDFKKLGQINGKQYFVPWDWGFTSILYRTDKVATPIDTWGALFDQKYKGHVSMWDDGPGAVTVSAYVHGYNETAITDEQLAAIKAEWIAQKQLNLFYWAGEPELQQGIRNGDVWVAYAWQGSYAVMLGEGVPVAYANPKEGRNSWVGFYGIRKGSPNKDLAMRFLDLKLGDQTMANVVNLFYYGAANKDVMAGITDATLKKAFSVDDPTVLQRTNFTPNVTDTQRNAWTQMWAEVKASS
jgi:spermidine/putrescine transport system substrate-binding protein